jgi:hypothetical protein
MHAGSQIATYPRVRGGRGCGHICMYRILPLLRLEATILSICKHQDRCGQRAMSAPGASVYKISACPPLCKLVYISILTSITITRTSSQQGYPRPGITTLQSPQKSLPYTYQFSRHHSQHNAWTQWTLNRLTTGWRAITSRLRTKQHYLKCPRISPRYPV